MPRGSSVIDIIINTRSGDQGDLDGLKQDLADVARGYVAFEGFNFLQGITEGAAALSEAQQTVDVVFGKSAASVRAFGQDAAESIGLGERAALAAAGNFGTLFSGMEIGQEGAAEMSKRMLDLAADMSAARNVPLDEAITAIFSGLSGEQEPLKRFGVLLSEAAVKEQALAMGLYDGVGQLDAASRAQATYSLVLDRTTTMHGAAAREMNGLLGEQKKSAAEWENLKDQLGENFIPIATGATEATSGVAAGFSSMDTSLQIASVGVAAWGLVGARATTVAFGFAGSLRNITSIVPATISTLNNSLTNINKTTTGFAAGAAGILSFVATYEALDAVVRSKAVSADAGRLAVALETYGRTGEVAGELEEFGDGLDRVGSAFRDLNRDRGDAAADFAKFAIPVIGPLWSGDSLTDAKSAKDTIDELDEGLANLVDAEGADVAAKSYGQVAAALVDQGVSVEEIVELFPEYWSAVDTAALSAENSADATEEDTAARGKNADAIRAQSELLARENQRYEDRVDRFEAVRSAAEGLRSAEEAAADAAEDLADAERAAGANSEENVAAREAEADALEGVQDALEGVRDAEEAVREAQERVGDAQRDLSQARVDAKEKIEDLAQAARDAVLDEREADLAASRAKIELEAAMRGNTSEQDRLEAQLAYDQAVAAAEAAKGTTAEAQAEAAAAAAAGVEGSPEVIAAKEAVAEATDGVADAHDRVREAVDGVTDANRRVRDAERNTAKVAEETAERYEEAKENSRKATQDVVDANADLVTAVQGSRAGVAALADGLKTLANTFAPGSPERTHLEYLVGLLEAIGNGGGLPTLPPGVTGPTLPGVGIPQDESRDPVRPNRSKAPPTLVYAPTFNGSAVEELRRVDQHGKDFLDKAARKFG